MMIENANQNQIIDRYVEEIGQDLPRKQRSDIQAEIRSSLMDIIEDRSQAGEDMQQKEAVFQVLKDYGSPQSVAAGYRSPSYLIGPQLYPIFILVLKILLYLLFAGLVLSFIFTQGYVITIAEGTSKMLLEMLAGFASSLFSMFGSLVLVFAILERTLPNTASRSRKNEKEWQPETLLKQKSGERVHISQQIGDIIVSLGLIIVLNFFPHWIGAFYSRNGEWGFVPLLSTAFLTYLPWITIRLGAGILFDILMLRSRTWTGWTRWISIGLNVFSLLILISMITGNPIVGLTPEFLQKTGSQNIDMELYQDLLPHMNLGINLTLGLVILGVALRTFRKLMEVVRHGEVITIPLKS